MSANLSHLLAFARTQTWAIRPDYAQTLADVLARRAAGVRLSDWEANELLADARTRAASGSTSAPRGVAVVPISGVLSARAGLMEQTSGMVSHEQVAAMLAAAEADQSVRAIVLDINSPGGTVAGTPELAATIRGLSKPVVAQVSYMAASAAYWLAAQADEIVVTPSGEVGSIGVVRMHEDVSKAADNEGVKVTFITAGKYKAEGNSFEPLSDDARAEAQRSVDQAFAMFVGDVAKGRGVSTATARGESFGQGRMLGAKDAVAAGMADRIATYDETIARLLGGGRVSKRGARAEIAYHELSNSTAPVAPAVADVAAAPEPFDDTETRERELALVSRLRPSPT